jgi:hypothetical protein
MGTKAPRRRRKQVMEDRQSYSAYRDAVRDMEDEETDLLPLAFDTAMTIARSTVTRRARARAQVLATW